MIEEERRFERNTLKFVRLIEGLSDVGRAIEEAGNVAKKISDIFAVLSWPLSAAVRQERARIIYAAYRECRWRYPGDMVTPEAIAHMLRDELPGWLWEQAGQWRYLTAREVEQIIESGETDLEIGPCQVVSEKALPCGFYRVVE